MDDERAAVGRARMWRFADRMADGRSVMSPALREPDFGDELPYSIYYVHRDPERGVERWTFRCPGDPPGPRVYDHENPPPRRDGRFVVLVERCDDADELGAALGRIIARGGHRALVSID